MKLVVDGESVFVHDGGVEALTEAPTVVLIHGAGQDHTIWAYQTRLLANAGIPAQAVDLPGHGRSEGVAPATIADAASWLRSFLDAAGIGRSLLVGHSMGSFIGIEAAATDPGRVLGLVLTGTSDRMPVHEMLLEAAGRGDDLAAELITGWTHSAGDRFGGNPAPGLWSRGLTSRLTERALGPTLRAGLDAVRNHDPTVSAAAVRCPVTVVVGAGDRMARADGALRLASIFPEARVVEISSGHGVMTDHPREVAAVIKQAYAELA